MNQREGDGAREFISLMEVERDETDADAGGWVTFDSFTAEGLDNSHRVEDHTGCALELARIRLA